MLLVPACKKCVIYLFLFVIFAFAGGQRQARGDHLKTLDFVENRDPSVD